MIKGLYTAASGMLVNQQKLDITSNNLANVNNTGYKKDQAIQRTFKEIVLERLEGDAKPVKLGKNGNGVVLDQTYTDYQQGNLKETGNSLDLALEGSGFFVVQTPAGLKYTRDGNFTLNKEGQIVTQQGYPVMGERGPLQTIDGQPVNIDTNGQLYLGDVKGDRVRVVEFSQPQLLEKEGDNLYASTGNTGTQNVQTADNYQLKQGYLESSNVNIVQEMVKMIQLSRNFEATQKVISTLDNALDKAVNSVGRVG